MEQLKHIKCTLINAVEAQLSDMKHVNTQELGEVIDMIKDIAKAMYYCSVVAAMEDADDKRRAGAYQYSKVSPSDAPQMMHYHDVEDYMHDVDANLTDMMHDSSIEEKQMISTKLQQLATKIK